MNLEELFRSVLEQSEQIPGDQVRNELMKKLARREFIRFNPFRFNVYYLTGIVAAAVTAAVILFSGPHQESGAEPGGVNEPVNKKEIQMKTSDSAESNTSGPVIMESQVMKEGGNSKSVGRSEADKPAADEGPSGPSARIRQDIIPDSSIKRTLKMDNLSDAGNNAVLRMRTVASFNTSVLSGCLPLKVSFRNNSQAYDSCRWTFGDGGFSDAKDPDWIFDRAGEFKVTLLVYGPGGEADSESVTVNIHAQPEARFEFQPEKPIIPDDAVRFINYSVDAVKCNWDFGDGRSSDAFEPEHKYNSYGSYDISLIVWSEHGCSDSVTVIDALAGSGCYIDFPNAFIPNPDGPSGGYYTQKSDEGAQIFHPVTSGVSEYQLRIFSKIGILIFESNDINIGWDGYHKGQLCEPGVYIWKVRGIYKNGEPFINMGDITLLKR